MNAAILILVVLLLVTLSGTLARLLHIPLPIVQIALGLALAWPADGPHVAIDPEAFLLIFIPPLLFSDAYVAPKREFSALRVPILGLAFGLVFFTVAAFGIALNWMIPALPLPVAFALAAVLSPTDAVAVSSILEGQSVPRRLMHILQGEALLNDASGLVIFRFAVAAVLTGHFSMSETAFSFVLVVLGGIVTGLISAFVFTQGARLLRRPDGAHAEAQVLIVLLLPFAAYLVAEHVKASGILAAVTAGLVIGPMGLFRYLSPPARLQSTVLWDTLSFVFNGAIFLLLGLQLPDIIRKTPPELSAHLPAAEAIITVLILTLLLILLRFVWISVGLAGQGLIERLRGREGPVESLRLRLAASVGGVRGAVTLAGILSLPLVTPNGAPFPARDLAIFLAAGVILCSLLLASLILPLLTRGLEAAEADPILEEERQARIAAAEAAIAIIEKSGTTGDENDETTQEVVARLTAIYRRRLDTAHEDEDILRAAQRASAIEVNMLLAAIAAERRTIRGLAIARKINDQTLHKLFNELILMEALVEQRKG